LWVWPRAYPIGAPERSAFFGYALGLTNPTNIRLGWKASLVTNTLSDYYNIKIVDINEMLHLKYKV
jgi:hypothetical protein